MFITLRMKKTIVIVPLIETKRKQQCENHSFNTDCYINYNNGNMQ